MSKPNPRNDPAPFAFVQRHERLCWKIAQCLARDRSVNWFFPTALVSRDALDFANGVAATLITATFCRADWR